MKKASHLKKRCLAFFCEGFEAAVYQIPHLVVRQFLLPGMQFLTQL
jgi:hypothetical protein